MISLRTMAHVAIDDGVGIVDDRAVPGQQPLRPQTAHALERRKVLGQIAAASGWNDDRPPGTRQVATENIGASTETEVIRRVAGRVNGRQHSIASFDGFVVASFQP